MKKVIKKHPLAIRWLHWINFPVIAIMIWSGMLIYWANDIYRVGFGSKTVLKFFPDSFYKALHIPFRLAEGMSLHFVFMWLFAINGLIYVLYLFISGEWRLIVPNKNSFKESLLVVLHDLHIRKTSPPQKKYNAAQRIAYTAVIIMGIGSVLTGLAIYKPVQFHILCSSLGGYEWARAEHFILTILFTLFFVIHVVQVIIAGWNNFRSMVTGLDVLRPGKNLQPVVVNMERATNKINLPSKEMKTDEKTSLRETGATHSIPPEDKPENQYDNSDKKK
ncbi:MAG: cytochrome b/b6 domain-containing protein [Ferruginibacter sp.]